MDVDYLIAIVISWVIICLIVGWVAKNKGRDAFTYFFIAIFLSPLFALIILAISGDSDEKKVNDVIIQNEVLREFDNEKVQNEKSNLEKYESLEKLGSLLEKMIITKEEFEEEKRLILGGNVNSNNSEDSIDEYKAALLKLKMEINSSNSGVISGPNENIPSMITTICPSKEDALKLLVDYRREFREDLIVSLSGISNQFTHIKHYLSPFIELNILEPNHPHKRLSSKNN